MVDGSYHTNTGDAGELIETYVPRSPEEMDYITLAVRNALGINDSRGDQLSVLNIAFQTPRLILPEETVFDWFKQNWYTLFQQILLGGAILGILFYVHTLIRKSIMASQAGYQKQLASIPGAAGIGELPGGAHAGTGRLALPDLDSELSPEIMEANQLQDRLVEFVEEKPETAAKLLKTWLVNG